LHANELVARDRLIEELWGDAAPATVNSVLNVYLTRVRRLLANGDGDGEAMLATQPPGYILRLPEQRLDARQFEALLEQAREALGRGDARQAAATLRTALSLWRGPALADLSYEPFAQSEIRRLEELRLAALEDRIDADLALGHQDTLVAELQKLVGEHPYRERLQGLLLLALYRSGRQAEALDAYRRARRTFADELGIDPGPRLQELERAILRHDPSLEAPPALPPAVADQENGRQTVSRPLRRWAGALAVGLVAALAIVSGLVAIFREGSETPPKPVVLKGDSVAVIDPTTTSVVAEIPIGARPSGIAVGEGSVWVANRDDNTLLRIDPRSRKIARTIGLPVEPRKVAVAAASVWVGDTAGEMVLRVDPDINDVVEKILLGRGSGMCCPLWLEVGGGAVWASRGGRLFRIDPATNTVATVRARGVVAFAYGEGDLWALTSDNRIDRIDPNTRAVVDSISRARVGQTDFGGGIAAGAGAVWTAPYLGKTLWKIDPVTGDFIGSVQLGRPPAGVAFGHGSLWIPHGDATLRRVDPRSEKITHTIALGVYVTEVAVGEGAVWVAVTR
jgi:YVTN family beta-propeller protein